MAVARGSNLRGTQPGCPRQELVMVWRRCSNSSRYSPGAHVGLLHGGRRGGRVMGELPHVASRLPRAAVPRRHCSPECTGQVCFTL